jgi:hypothetical protein
MSKSGYTTSTGAAVGFQAAAGSPTFAITNLTGTTSQTATIQNGTAIAITNIAGTTSQTATVASHSFVVGQVIVVSGNANAANNGAFTITAITPTTITYANATPGVATGATTPGTIASGTHNFTVGQTIQVTGNANAANNGYFTITAVSNTAASVTYSNASGVATGTTTPGTLVPPVSHTRTILNVIAPAQFGVDLQKIRLAFDSTSTSAVPVLVELCQSTQAGAGTGTAGTVNQIYGRAITAGFTTTYGYTTEPTVLTPIDSYLVTPMGGTVIYDYPLGTTPDTAVSAGLAIRITSTYAMNARATMIFERC